MSEPVPPQDGITCRLRNPNLAGQVATVYDSNLAIYGDAICEQMQRSGWY